MRALVVYESMYGNTHTVAEVIGKVLLDFGEARVVAVHDASSEMLDGVDLLVVGGPTHAHGMSRASTRKAAAEAVTKPDSDLTLDPDAAGDGIREWLESLSSDAGQGGGVRHPCRHDADAHRSRLERHRQEAPPAWARRRGSPGELPRHQGESPRAGRGGQGFGLGSASGRHGHSRVVVALGRSSRRFTGLHGPMR